MTANTSTPSDLSTFNRTIVELKLEMKNLTQDLLLLLIEPLWN